jgi:hypothetical protein
MNLLDKDITNELYEILKNKFAKIKDEQGLTEEEFKGFSIGYVLGTFDCYDKMKKKREKEER